MSDDAWAAYKTFVDRLASAVSTANTLDSNAKLEAHEQAVGPDEVAADDRLANAARTLLQELGVEQQRMVNDLLSFATETGAARVLYHIQDLMEEDQLHLLSHGVDVPHAVGDDDIVTSWLDRRSGKPWQDDQPCPVHQERLSAERVPVLHGRRAGPPREVSVLFPFANAVRLGSCFGGAATELTLYCTACRRGLLKWSRETGNFTALPSDLAGFEERYG